MKRIFFEGLKIKLVLSVRALTVFTIGYLFLGRNLNTKLAQILKILSGTLSENCSGFQKAVYCYKNCFQSRL
jgi:hypothetical protein